MGSKINTFKSESENKFYGDMKMIKTIDSLHASKNQNLPFNLDIPNVEEDLDNYNITINFGLFVKFFKQFLCCPDCGSNNVTIIVDLNMQMGFSNKLVVSCDDYPILLSCLPHNYVINLKKNTRATTI